MIRACDLPVKSETSYPCTLIVDKLIILVCKSSFTSPNFKTVRLVEPVVYNQFNDKPVFKAVFKASFGGLKMIEN